MPLNNTDAILWYDVGVFGAAGYAVPNWSNDVGSLNPQILDWCDLVGQNVFAMMHHEDVDMRTPPSINTLKRIHKLYLRAATILSTRMVPYGEDNMEIKHVRPAGEIFRVYPVPYFKVRNNYMKRWCGLILTSLAEAMQHTENRRELEISPAFAGQVGQYLKRVYQNMAAELFGKSREEVTTPGFLLQDAELAAYNPAQWFTQTELVDTVPRLDRVFTEDRLELLAEGIPVTTLPASVRPWPTNLTSYYAATRTDADARADQNAEGATNAPPETAAVSRDAQRSAAPVIPAAPGP